MSLSKRICFVFAVLLSTGLSADATEVLKIMPLGDSNTRGPHVAESGGPHAAALGAGGYRYPLQQMLTGGGYRFDFVGSQTSHGVGEQGNNPPSTWTYDPTFDPDHHGLAGFTSDMLISGGTVPQLPDDPLNNAQPLANCLSMYRPDIILLMSGTNGLNPANVEASLESLDRVIRTITATPRTTHVIVSTIFDRWNQAGFEKDAATVTYNAGIPGLVTAAQKRGELVSFVDCGGALTRDDFCFDGVLGDGVHPNPVLAMPKVADVWYEGIKSVVPLPEPSVLSLMACGIISVLVYAWRKWK